MFTLTRKEIEFIELYIQQPQWRIHKWIAEFDAHAIMCLHFTARRLIQAGSPIGHEILNMSLSGKT